MDIQEYQDEPMLAVEEIPLSDGQDVCGEDWWAWAENLPDLVELVD